MLVPEQPLESRSPARQFSSALCGGESWSYPSTQRHLFELVAMGRGGNTAAAKVPKYTLAEVAKHNTKDDAWLVYRSKVFDISAWGSHPGGQIIFTHAGRDATDVFNSFHPKSAYALLDRFYVGDLVKDDRGKEVTPFSRDMDVIRASAFKMGLHKARCVDTCCCVRSLCGLRWGCAWCCQ